MHNMSLIVLEYMSQMTRLTTPCSFVVDKSAPLPSDVKGGTVYIKFFHVMSCSDLKIIHPLIHPLTPLKMRRMSA